MILFRNYVYFVGVLFLVVSCQSGKKSDIPTEKNISEAFNEVVNSLSPPESILTTNNVERLNGTMKKGQQLEDGTFAMGTEYEVSLRFNIIATKNLLVDKKLEISKYENNGFALMAELVNYQYMHEYYFNKQKGYTPEWWEEKFKANEAIPSTVSIVFQKMENGWTRISPSEKDIKNYQYRAGIFRKYLE